MSTRMRGDDRKQQLLDIALNLFSENGFHTTSMDDVAEAAGVTKPVLYQHFPSKRALYQELLENMEQSLLDDFVQATTSTSSAREQAEAGFLAYFEWVAHNPNAFRLLFGTSVRDDPEFAVLADHFVEEATSAIYELVHVEGITEQQRLVIAHGILGIAESVARQTYVEVDNPIDPNQLAKWTAQLMWRGLRGISAN